MEDLRDLVFPKLANASHSLCELSLQTGLTKKSLVH